MLEALDELEKPEHSVPVVMEQLVEPIKKVDLSPNPTELEISDVEEIPESPKRCYCHELIWPDCQPATLEEWPLCDVCAANQAAANQVEMDAMSTVVDETLGDVAASMIESTGPQEVDGYKSCDDMNEMDPSPPRKLRRLRPLIVEPVLVDSPEPPAPTIEALGDQSGLEDDGVGDLIPMVSWITSCFKKNICNYMSKTFINCGWLYSDHLSHPKVEAWEIADSTECPTAMCPELLEPRLMDKAHTFANDGV